LLIEGAAGMGKSRLIAEAAEPEINSRVELTRLATERDTERVLVEKGRF
jgi:hypothetical protein